MRESVGVPSSCAGGAACASGVLGFIEAGPRGRAALMPEVCTAVGQHTEEMCGIWI